MQELSITLNGKHVAALTNGNTDKPMLLALHGWLDNAASFLPLSPFLDDYHFIALDLVGHGKSYHRAAEAHYNLVDYVQDLYALCEEHQWKDFFLLGHSLGGIISSMFTAAFPDHVAKLVCIETAGPLTEPTDTTVEQLRGSIVSRYISNTTDIKQPKSIEHIVASRCKVSDLSAQHAQLILQRNTQGVGNNELVWRTDKRLRTKSSIRLTEQQTENIIRHIERPCLIILGTKGFDKVSKNLFNRKSWFQQLTVETAQGGHHVHMESSQSVAQTIRLFLTQK